EPIKSPDILPKENEEPQPKVETPHSVPPEEPKSQPIEQPNAQPEQPSLEPKQPPSTSTQKHVEEDNEDDDEIETDVQEPDMDDYSWMLDDEESLDDEEDVSNTSTEQLVFDIDGKRVSLRTLNCLKKLEEELKPLGKKCGKAIDNGDCFWDA